VKVSDAALCPHALQLQSNKEDANFPTANQRFLLKETNEQFVSDTALHYTLVLRGAVFHLSAVQL
jgi:hypothetical protein